MKKNKKSSTTLQKIPDKFLPVPLVPAWVLLPLWFISLALPNLIYSGVKFADTLHILKWTATGVPIAVAVFIAGIRLFIYGHERVKIKFDIFSIIWAVILIYCLVQYFFIKVSSPTAFALEMTCFATVWAFYVISVSSFPDWGLRPVLILGNINAAINVIFAELQVRGMNDFAFLKGTIFEDLIQFSTIILPTPGNYIGNTAQQNMFGLWVSVSVLGAVYLYVFDAWKSEPDERGKKVWLPVASLILAVINLKFAIANDMFICGILAAIFVLIAFITAWKLGNKKHLYYSIAILIFTAWNFWGLMGSTSRSAALALIAGLSVIFIFAAFKFNKNYVVRFFAVMALMTAVFWASLYSPRSEEIVNKTQDIIQNYQTIGLRRGIWATSYALFTEYPQGVGIGQYKWHYLDGQREGFKIFNNPDWYDWQYTHWAHNEFLQFFCEGGLIGGIMFLLMYSMWFVPSVFGFFRKKDININAVWAVALATLITFCAVFTRPFHRIENMVWITLAFALANREFYPVLKFKTDFEIIQSDIFAKFVSVVCVVASIAGVVYISSGIRGNYILRKALSEPNANVRFYLLDEASKYPIVREDARRNIGTSYIQIGEQTHDITTILKGFDILWAQFKREPHSEDINTLLSFSQRFQKVEELKELASYFKPGTYHLKRVPHQNSDGRRVNALLLLNGPGSDDE